MKRLFIFAAVVSVTAVISGCMRENPEIGLDGDVVTMTASFPSGELQESPESRVAFADGETAIKLSWEKSDNLRVIGGGKDAVYSIKDFTEKQATFEGKEVKEGPYTVILPGSYASEEAVNARSYASQTQTGNGSTAHLRYNAMLTGVKDYKSVSFTPEWAQANGATFKENGTLKLVMSIPLGAKTATKVAISSSDKSFYATNAENSAGRAMELTLKNFDVPANGDPLVCYFDLSWQGAVISGSSILTVSVTTDIGSFMKTFKPSQMTLTGGKMYTITLDRSSWASDSSFAGGDGTEQKPFLIANYIHMNSIASALSNGQKIWFKMISDVDMDPSVAGKWDPLNSVSTYDKAIDFNGDGHVIKNLTIEGSYQHCGFVSILNGTVRNVIFENAKITNGYTGDNNDTGIVTAFAGYGASGKDYPALIENVEVRNSSITTSTILQTGGVGFGAIAGSGVYGKISHCRVDGFTINCDGSRLCNIMGGAVGRILSKAVTIEYVSVRNTKLKGHGFIGGVVGYVNDATPPLVDSCSFNGEIDANTFAGGIVGATRYPMTISTCESRGSIIIHTGKHIGGILGGADVASHKASNIMVQGCTSYMDIFARPDDSRAGGIVGSFPSGADDACIDNVVDRCVFKGTISTVGDVPESNKSVYYGGIVGVIYNGTIRNCINLGTLTASERQTHHGGITAYASASTITGCEFRGTFQNNLAGSVGGIAAALTLGTKVTDNVVSSDVKGATNVGGVFGLVNNSVDAKVVSGNLVKGDVIGVAGVGGIGGRMSVTDVSGHSFTLKDNLVYSPAITATRDRDYNATRSSGAIIGEIDGQGYTLSNNFHSSSLVFTDGAESVADRTTSTFDQPGPYVWGSSPLTWDLSATYYQPYHGAATTATASAQANTIGWSSAIWDTSGDMPVLYGLVDLETE